MKLILCVLITALCAFGADVAGKWKAKTEGPNGPMERTFDFKVAGEKLSGETVSSFAGKSEIMEGKIVGDDLSFVITVHIQDNDMKVNYKGKVINKDEIKLTADVQGNQIEWVAKREQ